jgi:5-phospho-D-xylono-1,4-lactonase
VRTVLGDLDPAELGATNCHDHLFIAGGAPVRAYPDFLLNDYEKGRQDVASYVRAGGHAIVEMSPIDWGRDAKNLVRVSAETGLAIIAATGFHKVTYYDDIHWIHHYSEEQLIDLLCAELRIGMDLHNYSGPIVERTDARAGVIKVGTRAEPFDATQKKLLRVAAAAHLETGAPIITHTEEGARALDQVSFLQGEGVEPQHIALSHMDRMPDLSYQKEVAATGVFLVYDGLARVARGLHTIARDLVVQMCSEGWTDSLVLGGDISRRGYWRSWGGEPGLDFVVDGFKRMLRDAGIPPPALEKIYVENPRRLLTWRTGASKS